MPRRRKQEPVELPPDPRDYREPFDTLPGEPPKAYHWFSRYLRLGYDRSLARVVSQAYDEGRGTAKGTPDVRQLKRWSARWRWIDRARAYDAHLERQKRERDEDALLAASEAGAARLKAFMRAAQQPIEDLLNTIRSAEYREWYESLDFAARWQLGIQMAKMLPPLLDAERVVLGAKLDAASMLASSSRSDEVEEAAGLLEMDSLERVAAVLSVLEDTGFRPRRKR